VFIDHGFEYSVMLDCNETKYIKFDVCGSVHLGNIHV
jgi:hypothetical protein